jgi:hypothetical protein
VDTFEECLRGLAAQIANAEGAVLAEALAIMRAWLAPGSPDGRADEAEPLH